MLTSLAVSFLPVITMNGQETKSEKKIKIVVKDDNGTKVIVDTLLKDGSDIEKIKLDDGSYVFISRPDADHNHSGSKHVTVTITSDDENGEKLKEVEEINFFTSDSIKMRVSEGGEKVYMITTEVDDQHSGKSGNVAVWTSKGDDDGAENVYIVKKSNGSEQVVEKTVKVHVSTDGKETASETAKYIVAKDGMVVTVEGEDEAKAKDLMKLIEDYLGVKNSTESKAGKSETKKNKK